VPDGLEEHEIAGANLVPTDFPTPVVLLLHLAGKEHSLLSEYPLDEPAAIESACGFATAIQIGGATQGERSGNQLR
jgi:hypothetical protein